MGEPTYFRCKCLACQETRQVMERHDGVWICTVCGSAKLAPNDIEKDRMRLHSKGKRA